jgi:hypothetical protein
MRLHSFTRKKYYTLFDWSSRHKTAVNGNILWLLKHIHVQHVERCEIGYYSAGNNRFVFMTTSVLPMPRQREGHKLSEDP